MNSPHQSPASIICINYANKEMLCLAVSLACLGDSWSASMTVTYDLGCELGELGINNQNPKMKCFVWLCLWHSWGILGVRPRIPKIKCFVCCILGILAGFLGFTPTAGILAMLLISMPFPRVHSCETSPMDSSPKHTICAGVRQGILD